MEACGRLLTPYFPLLAERITALQADNRVLFKEVKRLERAADQSRNVLAPGIVFRCFVLFLGCCCSDRMLGTHLWDFSLMRGVTQKGRSLC